jgi:hypothetical protein
MSKQFPKRTCEICGKPYIHFDLHYSAAHSPAPCEPHGITNCTICNYPEPLTAEGISKLRDLVTAPQEDAPVDKANETFKQAHKYATANMKERFAFLEDAPAGELKEKLAAIEHERWADWQKWCHQVIRENMPLEVMIKLDPILERWDKQIITPYSRLSDKEKTSDMEQVDRYWPLIQEYINAEVRAVLEELKEHRKTVQASETINGEWYKAVDIRLLNAEIEARK